MHDAIYQMLERYACESANEYRNALKEIIQDLALFGLWRTKFFEHAAFYGGTALRILYQLDRFSEDLDFTLLQPNRTFDLSRYEKGVQRELEAFGFKLTVQVKDKSQASAVQSAFIKADTLKHLLKIGLPVELQSYFHPQERVKIKFEIDTDPPLLFSTEAKPLLTPAAFSIPTYTLPDMFAGKLSALLLRQWKHRVKGRDWYDFLWFLKRRIPVHLAHFQARLEQVGKWDSKEPITLSLLHDLLHEQIERLDLAKVREDVAPFIKTPALLDGWSKELFHGAVSQITPLPQSPTD